ncbi:MAG TPA: hypothetical protein ENN41_05535, partial [Sediminispirochaeta sp.]|nr:hypothetical protein [Sediminispirochaeta sp.]
MESALALSKMRIAVRRFSPIVSFRLNRYSRLRTRQGSLFMAKPRILTGDRPTGKLHLGHYVGSIQN